MDFKIGTYKGLSYEEYAAIPAYRSHDLMARRSLCVQLEKRSANERNPGG